MEEEKKKKKPTTTNLAFLPAFGAGHTPSTIELARRLVLHPSASNRLSATLLLTPSTASFISSLSLSLPTSISIHLLPSIPLPPLLPPDGFSSHAALCFQLYTPHIQSALAALSSSALFIDFFATATIDAADRLRIPTYVYTPFNASMLSLILHLPTLHHQTPPQHHIPVPGLPPIPLRSIPTPLLDKHKPEYTWTIYHANRLKHVRGILSNTFRALENGPISAMESDESLPAIHPVGPILQFGGAGAERHECLRWLDERAAGSVVFLCFGSMGMMTAAQAAEAAAGIERSGQSFLWILRLAGGEPEPEGILLGFRERTEGKGKVWEGWVPQREVLGHAAVGGFVTHGGWNSCLEALWHGVPMVAWPMYAEQHLNAFVMGEEMMGVAAEVAEDRRREGWVTAEEVERKVRWLMEESEGVRERVREMKKVSREAVEEGGASWDRLGIVVAQLLNESSNFD